MKKKTTTKTIIFIFILVLIFSTYSSAATIPKTHIPVTVSDKAATAADQAVSETNFLEKIGKEFTEEEVKAIGVLLIVIFILNLIFMLSAW